MKRRAFQTTIAYKPRTAHSSSSWKSLVAAGMGAALFFSPLPSSDLVRAIDPPEAVEKPEDTPPPQPETAPEPPTAPAAELPSEVSEPEVASDDTASIVVKEGSVEVKSSDGSVSITVEGEPKAENPSAVEADPSSSSSKQSSTLSEDSINSSPVYGTDRPDWLGRRPDVSGEIHQVYVGTDLKSSPEECKKDYERALLQAVREYLNESVLIPDNAEDIPELTGKYVREHWVDGTRDYLAKVKTGEGNFYQLWSVVELDSDDRKEILGWQAKVLQPKRIEAVAAGLVGALTIFGVINLGARFTGRRRNVAKK